MVASLLDPHDSRRLREEGVELQAALGNTARLCRKEVGVEIQQEAEAGGGKPKSVTPGSLFVLIVFCFLFF